LAEDEQAEQPEQPEQAEQPEQSGPAGQKAAGQQQAAQQPPAGAREPTIDELIEQIRNIELGQFLLSSVSTLASLTYAKLEAGALDQAKLGIDALGALIPVLEGAIESDTARDLHAALANLQLAYADAAR
jgi:hypothetical protein